MIQVEGRVPYEATSSIRAVRIERPGHLRGGAHAQRSAGAGRAGGVGRGEFRGGGGRAAEPGRWPSNKKPLVHSKLPFVSIFCFFLVFSPVGLKRNRSLLENFHFSRGLKQMEQKAPDFPTGNHQEELNVGPFRY